MHEVARMIPNAQCNPVLSAPTRCRVTLCERIHDAPDLFETPLTPARKRRLGKEGMRWHPRAHRCKRRMKAPIAHSIPGSHGEESVKPQAVRLDHPAVALHLDAQQRRDVLWSIPLALRTVPFHLYLELFCGDNRRKFAKSGACLLPFALHHRSTREVAELMQPWSLTPSPCLEHYHGEQATQHPLGSRMA